MISALIDALKEEDWSTSQRTIAELVAMGDVAIPSLVDASGSHNRHVRQHAVDALGKIGNPSAIPALLTALRDSEESVSMHAVRALEQIGKEAVPCLIQALPESDPTVHHRIISALVAIGDAAAVPTLIAALEDTNVAWAAANGLGQIRDTSAIPALIAALHNTDERIRRAAVWALEKIGDAPVSVLIEVYEDSEGVGDSFRKNQ